MQIFNILDHNVYIIYFDTYFIDEYDNTIPNIYLHLSQKG